MSNSICDLIPQGAKASIATVVDIVVSLFFFLIGQKIVPRKVRPNRTGPYPSVQGILKGDVSLYH